MAWRPQNQPITWTNDYLFTVEPLGRKPQCAFCIENENAVYKIAVILFRLYYGVGSLTLKNDIVLYFGGHA